MFWLNKVHQCTGFTLSTRVGRKVQKKGKGNKSMIFAKNWRLVSVKGNLRSLNFFSTAENLSAELSDGHQLVQLGSSLLPFYRKQERQNCYIRQGYTTPLGKFSWRKDMSVLPVTVSQLITCSHLINYFDTNVYLKRDSKRKGFTTLLCSGLLSQEFEILQQHGHSPSEFSLDCITRELLLQKQHFNSEVSRIWSHRHFMSMALPGKLHVLIPRSSLLPQSVGYELCHR